MATSEDNFIADTNGGVDWLPPPNSDPNDECGFKTFLNAIDTILIGSKSFKQAFEWGWNWNDKRTFVFSKDPLLICKKGEYPTCINISNEKPEDLVKRLKGEAGKGI
jgi:dihydrofolate reductase